MQTLRQVLLVEDNSLLRRNVKRYLDAQGFAVTATHDCAGARAALRSRRQDVAIFDLRLPDGLGLDLMGELPTPGTPPVIIISADANPHWEQQAIDLGAAAFVYKPFSLDTLSKVVCCVADGGRCLPYCKRSGGCPLSS